MYQDGRACEGSFNRDFSNLLGQLDFKKLAFLIHQFLKSYNNNSPVQNITNFKLIKKDKT